MCERGSREQARASNLFSVPSSASPVFSSPRTYFFALSRKRREKRGELRTRPHNNKTPEVICLLFSHFFRFFSDLTPEEIFMAFFGGVPLHQRRRAQGMCAYHRSPRFLIPLYSFYFSFFFSFSSPFSFPFSFCFFGFGFCFLRCVSVLLFQQFLPSLPMIIFCLFGFVAFAL